MEASDGNTYQGYVIEDEYGTRLVDETNSIILVGDEEGWKVAESKKYSEEYPAVFSETKIGKADGFEIPITIGLSANVKEGIDFTYSEVHMTQLGADDVASLYLHSAWRRYVNIMYHSDVTYEEYLVLLKEGKGNIEILDSTSKEPVLIDPRQGFSLVITGDKTVEMPIKHADDWGFNYDVDNKGKLLWAFNNAYFYHRYINRDTRVKDNAWFLFNSIGCVSWISVVPDKCMQDKNVQKICGVISPPDPNNLDPQFLRDVEDFLLDKSSNPVVSLN